MRVATALAYVCRNLPDIRDILGDDGDAVASPLQSLFAAVESGDAERIGESLDVVHAAVQAAGDPLGVYGGARRGLAPAGTQKLEVVFRCPLQRCVGRDRSEVPDDGAVCAISGHALVRERLP